jgi:hypothetical protein
VKNLECNVPCFFSSSTKPVAATTITTIAMEVVVEETEEEVTIITEVIEDILTAETTTTNKEVTNNNNLGQTTEVNHHPMANLQPLLNPPLQIPHPQLQMILTLPMEVTRTTALCITPR